MNKKGLDLKVCLITLVFAFYIVPNYVWPQELLVRIAPSKAEVKCGDTAVINVTIENANNLGAFQFDLLYDTHIVNADTTHLTGFSGSTGRTVVPIKPIIDNVNNPGKITFAAYSLGTTSGPTGSGILASVSLITKDIGYSLLNLNNVQITDIMGVAQAVITVHDGVIMVTDSTLSVIDIASSLPDDFKLLQNHPNPFNTQTRILFEVPKPGEITLKIYNLLGQEIKTLIQEVVQPGLNITFWDGRDRFGKLVPSGIYILQLQTEAFFDKKKMLLVK